MAVQDFYIGIDISDKYAVISFFEQGMKEPSTVSMIAGSEVFQIPVQIAKKKGMGQWFVGEDAGRIAEEQQGTVIDQLLSRALRQEELLIDGERYLAEELLVLFLKKVTGYAGGIYGAKKSVRCAFTFETLTAEISKLFGYIAEKLGMDREQILLLDRKAAFYYYALNQKNELWLHDVCLYEYWESQVKCLRLCRNRNTIPQLITIEEQVAVIDTEQEDASFYQLLQNHIKGHIVSSAYLIGDAFQREWMNLSLAYLCRGRRAFMGKNLYAKGACYAAMVANGEILWPYVYIGDNEIKANVSLKVKSYAGEEFYTLLEAGQNWYDAFGQCEVILDDTKEVAIWLQLPNSKDAKVEKLTLADLPERENKTTRLQIIATPLSDTQVQIQIKDLGFGEIAKSSGLSWEYNMSV